MQSRNALRRDELIKILPVIILYRQALTACRSYNTLLRGYDGKIFVFDNSPEAAMLPDDPRIIYYHAPENPGISTGYNFAADYALKNEFSWLLLLDQDSEFTFPPAVYIDAVCKNPEIGLFAPAMKTSQGIPMSPVNLQTLFPTAEEMTPGRYPLKSYVPVNSGSLVSTELFWKCGGYNEKVFLDHSDYDFMERLAMVTENFILIDGTVIQDYSGDEVDPERICKRFILFLKSARNCVWRTLFRKLKMDFFVFCRALIVGKQLNMRLKILRAWFKIFVLRRDEA